MLGTQEGVGDLGHLEGIHEVFYQEEMPQLGGRKDHLGGNLLGQTFCLLPSQGQVHVQVGPERTKGCEVSQWVDGTQAEGYVGEKARYRGLRSRLGSGDGIKGKRLGSEVRTGSEGSEHGSKSRSESGSGWN